MIAELQKCAAIGEQSARLAAYDKLQDLALHPNSTIQYAIVRAEHSRVGGALHPTVVSPKYSVLTVRSVLVDSQATPSKATVSEILKRMIDDAKAVFIDFDGLDLFLYESQSHYEGGNLALGRVRWGPRGNNYDPENAEQVSNKSAYEVTLDVFESPFAISDDKILTRLDEAARRVIFKALIESQDRATREAEARFPLKSRESFGRGNYEAYRVHVLETTKAQETEKRRLMKLYEKELLEARGLTQEELNSIYSEAMAKQWPFPKQG